MRVIGLWRFPVKSFAGEALDHVEVGQLGFDGDRQWGVQAVETGKVLTARREPHLLFASARLNADGSLDARLPDGSPAHEASLSDWLGYPVRLIRASADAHTTYETPIDFEKEDAHPWFPWDGPHGVFHDSGRTRFSLVSTDTLGDWDLRRFRTNVIVDDGGEDEMIGRTIRIGTVEASITKPIDRCVMTTRPQPGIDRDLDVLRAINRDRGGNLAIGAAVTTPGTIALGDEVEVLD